jgi:hypothetical protein
LNIFNENILLSATELEVLKTTILELSQIYTLKAIEFCTGRFQFERAQKFRSLL